MARVWVGLIRIDDDTDLKLRLKHQMTSSDVRAAASGRYLNGDWQQRPGRGRRFVATVEHDTGPLRVVLQPVNTDGDWLLVTAYPVP